MQFRIYGISRSKGSCNFAGAMPSRKTRRSECTLRRGGDRNR